MPTPDAEDLRRAREVLARHPLIDGHNDLPWTIIDSLEPPSPPLSMVADHVDHVAMVAGHDHVGIGGDYDGNRFWPIGLEDVSGYPHLFAELLRRG